MKERVSLLDVAQSRANGFDTVRLLAAAAVLGSHAFALTGLREPLEGSAPGMTLGTLAVGVFFVTSGLLITMSADRRSTRRFIAQRAGRIMPALIACVLVCLALGAALTSLPSVVYASSGDTWRFAGNAVLLPAPFGLPGVFEGNPVAAVNGSLWTLKFEVACYAVSFWFAHWRLARRELLIIVWIASLLIAHKPSDGASGAVYYVEQFAFLFRFYGAGMLLYAYRDRISLRADWAVFALLATCASPLLRLFAEVAATFGSYALVVFAYRAPGWFRKITRRGDISYGVYLYAFPIQQMLVPLSLKTPLPWLTNMALALPLTLVAGTLSWLLIERRFLKPSEKHSPAAHAF